MKNPYKRGKVHPSPPPPLPDHFHFLSLLPAALLTLTAALSPDDQHVLAYLISCCPSPDSCPATPRRRAPHRTGDDRGGGDHGPTLGCDCFRCYMTYWVRWDASPNRHLIHEIIEAYEEDQLALSKSKKKVVKKKKDRGKRSSSSSSVVADSVNTPGSSSSGSRRLDDAEACNKEEGSGAGVEIMEPTSSSFCQRQDEDEEGEKDEEKEKEKESVDQPVARDQAENKGTVRKVVGFLGEKIWGFWSRD